MLSDRVINGFQSMIKRPLKGEIHGFQDPILGQTLGFNIFRNVPFVEILLNGEVHWLAISTYVCKQGEVNSLDNLFKGKVKDHSRRQI